MSYYSVEGRILIICRPTFVLESVTYNKEDLLKQESSTAKRFYWIPWTLLFWRT
jgi:hypothetical protein